MYYAMHVQRHRTRSLPVGVKDAKGKKVVMFAAMFNVRWERLAAPRTSIWFGPRGRYGLVMQSTREGEGVDLSANFALFFETAKERKRYARARIAKTRAGMLRRQAQRAKPVKKPRRERLIKLFQRTS